MKQNITQLDVYYNNRFVGTLKKIDSYISFQYSDEWIHNGFSISPFSLPLTKSLFHSNKEYFEGVFGVFYDSLPDGWGRLLMNRYLAKQGINYESLPILDKLSLTTILSKGALEYRPHNKDIDINNNVDLDSLAESFKNIYDDISYDNLDTAYYLGGSSGGARPKIYVDINNEKWIIKFPCSNDPINIGEEEYLANKLAEKCDIYTNEYQLFPSKKCKGYFGAKRFDRIDNKKVHMISLSSILETSYRIPNLDYELLFKVTSHISNNPEDLYEVFKRMVFNILYLNKDDHGNNFSFIYDEDNNTYRLSPFYDITSTPKKVEHEMTLLGNANPTIDDIYRSIDIFGLNKDKCLYIIDKIKSVLSCN